MMPAALRRTAAGVASRCHRSGGFARAAASFSWAATSLSRRSARFPTRCGVSIRHGNPPFAMTLTLGLADAVNARESIPSLYSRMPELSPLRPHTLWNVSLSNNHVIRRQILHPPIHSLAQFKPQPMPLRAHRPWSGTSQMSQTRWRRSITETDQILGKQTSEIWQLAGPGASGRVGWFAMSGGHGSARFLCRFNAVPRARLCPVRLSAACRPGALHSSHASGNARSLRRRVPKLIELLSPSRPCPPGGRRRTLCVQSIALMPVRRQRR